MSVILEITVLIRRQCKLTDTFVSNIFWVLLYCTNHLYPFSGSPNQIAGPSIVIFDLNTDQLLHRYFFKISDMTDDSFFANILSISTVYFYY